MDTNTWANRIVAGWEVYLRKAPWQTRWQISLCDRVLNPRTALMEGQVRSKQLLDHPILRETFDTPDDAAAAVGQLLSA